MPRLFLLAAVLLSAACAAAEAPDTPAETPEEQSETGTVTEIIEAPAPAIAAPAAACGGALTQGGLVICQGTPGTAFTVAGKTLTAGEDGSAQFGLGTAAPAVIGWSHESGAFGDLAIAPRKDDYRVLTGLDCDKVDARSPEQKAHASRSWVKKQDAFASFNTGPGALTGFVLPSDAPASSPFGPTRKYTGVSAVTGEPCESTSVHRGYDMAAPIGTEVVAPAAGTVILADPDLYYEGGTVFLDHGHGLVSVFMHLSEVTVEAGDTVARGDLLAKTGNSGRTTGPHLHWAVKWRNPEADARDGDFYIDPALLLDLPLSE